MKRALLLAALLSTGCAEPAPPPEAEPAPLPALTPDEVERLAAAGSAKLYDANPREMYEVGRLPGARWVKFNEVTAAALGAAPADKLVFYCANELCTASDEAARRAVALGFTDVSVMPAGYFGWKKLGKPVERPGG